jgi:hypothetical protein
MEEAHDYGGEGMGVSPKETGVNVGGGDCAGAGSTTERVSSSPATMEEVGPGARSYRGSLSGMTGTSTWDDDVVAEGIPWSKRPGRGSSISSLRSIISAGSRSGCGSVQRLSIRKTRSLAFIRPRWRFGLSSVMAW